jgi:hypothetical protein
MEGWFVMKKWIARGFVAFMVLSLACSLPALSGCGGRKPKEDPKSRPDFVDTSDPSKVEMKPIGGPAEGSTSDAGAAK